MNSLLGYGSDDDSSEEKPTDSYTPSRSYRRPGQSRQEDVNYDEVQMSLSEDSSDESKPRDPPRRQGREGENSRWNGGERRSASRPRDDHSARRDRKDDRYAGRERGDEDRSRHRDDERTRERYRGEKEDERSRDRRDDRRAKSKERYSDRFRDRKDRDRRRSRSPRDRERRRSRSPRRSRSRSRSKDRANRGGFSKRFDRASTKIERLDKMDTPKQGEDKPDPKDRFFVPGITGRFREQIEKRKLLWQKKEPEKQATSTSTVAMAAASSQVGPRATKVWEATTFAQDTDGKVANKFKRLMGIKNVGEGSNTAADVLKKQEEMFSSMEQQYEVARTATHTMRGVGLGFGSYQR